MLHLDRLWHKADYSPEAKQWFIQQQRDFMAAHDNWIIDGNYGGTMPLRLAEADLVLWLQVNRVQAIIRVVRRSLRYHWDKASRPDMAAGFTEHWNRDYWNFLAFVWHYDDKKWQKVLAQRPAGTRLVVLRGKRAKRTFMDRFPNSGE
ncbi:hypothetical protein [Schleiferilactobacillus shenzhenensis]|uniref:Topology modulation protein n=1 Tax=Schleiferilactobacillus shenzhenensis LY-73 TaxID=1231336 RepID=U4TJV4_9LACO|nr:hypothetical protein [Schleiferilactobacillus shenzhenensis]ERL65121.1 hypothetical protein L248_3059 [Schleiferilactobacillus shenzhenensis LY-73]